MRPLNNSAVAGFAPKHSELGTDEYIERVASPVMQAIDAMPKAYRECVNEFGYVDVYRAWKRGWTPAMIRQRASGGAFHFT